MHWSECNGFTVPLAFNDLMLIQGTKDVTIKMPIWIMVALKKEN